MDFDQIIERRGSNCSKWDKMETLFGVPASDGLAMWVADMDFRPPACVADRLRAMLDHGVFGYMGSEHAYHQAIQWWMRTRHGWDVNADWIFSTAGLVNGTAVCVDAFTQPGDHVVMFTPIYHAFFRVLAASGRPVTELPMVLDGNRYGLDFDAYDSMMTGRERMLILCSPHNPGGRVWSRDELAAVADFARRHDLIIVSDEIHHDLVMPGHTHVPMALIPGIENRLVMMTASTKTFNIAGAHTGNVIIADADLRRRFGQRIAALGLSPGSFGVEMATAAYSPEGAAWVDALTVYLDGNRRAFEAAIDAIPGLRAVPIEATYLCWVDFSGTGMAPKEFIARVEKDARIAANHGSTFGKGGESFLRFNVATPRARVNEAAQRLAAAFADLQ